MSNTVILPARPAERGRLARLGNLIAEHAPGLLDTDDLAFERFTRDLRFTTVGDAVHAIAAQHGIRTRAED